MAKKLRYRVHQTTPEGAWISEVFEAGEDRHAAQNVIAGFLSGQARWAVEEGTFRFLYGLDAKGKAITAPPADPVGTSRTVAEDEGTSPATERS